MMPGLRAVGRNFERSRRACAQPLSAAKQLSHLPSCNVPASDVFPTSKDIALYIVEGRYCWQKPQGTSAQLNMELDNVCYQKFKVCAAV